MFEEVVRADKKYRRKLFVSYLVLLLGVFAVIRFGVPWLRSYLQSLPADRAILVIEIVTITFLIGFIGPAMYLISYGRKIIRYQCIPFPGAKVIRDTRVKRGLKAVRMGKMLCYLGITCIVLALAGSIAIHVIMDRFLNVLIPRALHMAV